jgi:hypothetical protein
MEMTSRKSSVRPSGATNRLASPSIHAETSDPFSVHVLRRKKRVPTLLRVVFFACFHQWSLSSGMTRPRSCRCRHESPHNKSLHASRSRSPRTWSTRARASRIAERRPELVGSSSNLAVAR